MNDKKIEELKKQYMNTPIPEELDFLVRKTLKDGGIKTMKKNNKYRWISIAASVAVIFTASVNISPTFADALSEVPVIKGLVKVLTFREYKVDEDTYNANIKIPAIEGLENKDLENKLNEKYLQENKKLYEDFMSEIEDLKANGGGHLGVDSGYEIKADNDRILSIGRYIVNTVGSSSTVYKFDTIDKRNEVLITLPSLFKDSSYIDIISENIIDQMKEQMELDGEKIYWIEGYVEEGFTEVFEKISGEQNFYITEEGKLVISFNKYDVAPGYMGVVEFEIPTDVISDILVSDEYISLR
ncbi:protein of unknown function [Proteiniborus ethanoligenes]|uniref:Uncharacterized protein n=1 Tax=Proteiniborus ethanoligenes TaxID=415015 RepID=A0A1H3MWX5_9FIRM|nr:anti-sigma-V factor rsiV [Proteiniborus ethanoligenes]TAH61449.1 MAG: anti-sigma-V factor rsiV [Gottschalkiaceae bacterium]SDY80725.1 protein of unknown function [Proteiniborus ethanoligenes]